MPFSGIIQYRIERARAKEKELLQGRESLQGFALGHHFFGLHPLEKGWVLREWAPNASAIFLLGDFSQWQANEKYQFTAIGDGIWELILTEGVLKHGDLYKLKICWPGGEGERIPAWTNRVVQDTETLVFNAQVWAPEKPHKWKNAKPKGKNFNPIIYEAHVGMATEEWKVGSFDEFRVNILPRIAQAGYNTIQLMGIQEHPYYGSFGYHVSSFFAVSSRFGTPDELKALIDEAHGMGIRVIMDMVHSHAVKNEVEGISRYDGSYYQFFHDGPKGQHPAWDSRCFDYGKNQVLHFLLSNCKYWIEEYRFDGYRFDGVTSMLYLDHGLGSNFLSYNQYFDANQDEDAITYMFLANKLIHQVNPSAITVAEEMSGMPGLAVPQAQGGIGFDFRLAMGVPDFWIKTIKEVKDEFWHVGDIYYQLSSKRADEATIHYAESHDQALVGDKTIIFRLMDKEMYYLMRIDHQSLIIDRGMALHKMIRLATIVSAGNGYLNFMGNEFGHPEWIDFPARHNDWSYKYARRQWSLADDPELKYQFLALFDKEMIHLVKDEKLFEEHPYAVVQNVSDQILVVKRGAYLFVFNFSPFNSYTDYGIDVEPGKYRIVLNTDNEKFQGFSRIDETIDYEAFSYEATELRHQLKLYIPAQTAFVLKHKK